MPIKNNEAVSKAAPSGYALVSKWLEDGPKLPLATNKTKNQILIAPRSPGRVGIGI